MRDGDARIGGDQRRRAAIFRALENAVGERKGARFRAGGGSIREKRYTKRVRAPEVARDSPSSRRDLDLSPPSRPFSSFPAHPPRRASPRWGRRPTPAIANRHSQHRQNVGTTA